MQCIRGIGVESNEVLARRWLESAAKLGEPESQVDLAIMYMLGMGGLSKDSSWLRIGCVKGHGKGHPFAQYELGVAYRAGVGVEETLRKLLGGFINQQPNAIPMHSWILDLCTCLDLV